jgi:hypothetical protein
MRRPMRSGPVSCRLSARGPPHYSRRSCGTSHPSRRPAIDPVLCQVSIGAEWNAEFGDSWTDRDLAGSIGIGGFGRSDPDPSSASGSSARRPDHRRRARSPRVRGLRCEAVVVAQQATEAFSTRDRSSGIGVLVSRRRRRGDQPVVEALVVALEMIVRDELRDRQAEVALTERNELVEAFALDREHESLRKAFKFGLRAGSLRHLMPVARRIARNASVNSGSRSWIR